MRAIVRYYVTIKPPDIPGMVADEVRRNYMLYVNGGIVRVDDLIDLVPTMRTEFDGEFNYYLGDYISQTLAPHYVRAYSFKEIVELIEEHP